MTNIANAFFRGTKSKKMKKTFRALFSFYTCAKYFNAVLDVQRFLYRSLYFYLKHKRMPAAATFCEKQEERCLCFIANGKTQCKRKKAEGSDYCFQHQSCANSFISGAVCKENKRFVVAKKRSVTRLPLRKRVSAKKSAERRGNRKTISSARISKLKKVTPLTMATLKKLDLFSEKVVYNGEEFWIRGNVRRETLPLHELDTNGETVTTYRKVPVLLFTMDYVDRRKKKEFISTCSSNFNVLLPMVEQTWSIKDGKLYLDNQDNLIHKDVCAGTDEASRVLRGAARFLWCKFMENGIAKNIFNRGTMIELEARGCFTECRKDNAFDLGMPLLVSYYENMGFQKTGQVSNFIFPGTEMRYPFLHATVGTVMDRICAKK